METGERKATRAPAPLPGARPEAGRAAPPWRPRAQGRGGQAQPGHWRPGAGNQGDSPGQGREPIRASPGPFQKSKANNNQKRNKKKKRSHVGGWAGRRGPGPLMSKRARRFGLRTKPTCTGGRKSARRGPALTCGPWALWGRWVWPPSSPSCPPRPPPSWPCCLCPSWKRRPSCASASRAVGP